ncbi:hypothetical protein D3C78_977270 [compost metagenome]
MLAEQGKHAVVGHHRWRLIQQVIFKGAPEQAQRLEEITVRVILGETHLAYGRRNVQPEVLDKARGGDKTIQ